VIVVQWVSQHVGLGFWEEVVPSTTHQVYGGTQHHLGGVGTKKTCWDGLRSSGHCWQKCGRSLLHLNYPNDLPASGTSKDGTDDVDLPTTTIKQRNPKKY